MRGKSRPLGGHPSADVDNVGDLGWRREALRDPRDAHPARLDPHPVQNPEHPQQRRAIHSRRQHHGRSGERGSRVTDDIDPQVIAVPVPATGVVDRQDVGLFLDEHRGKQLRGVSDGDVAERPWWRRLRLVEARVAEPERNCAVDPQGGSGDVELREPPLPQTGGVGGKTALTVRRDNDDDPVPLADTSRQGAAHQQRLVVRVGMERHERVDRAMRLGDGRSPRRPDHSESSPLGQEHMRILHVTDVYLPRLGGIETHVADLARAQRLAGDHVDVLTLTTSPISRGRSVIAPPANASIWAKARFVRQHRTYGRDNGYHVIHVHLSAISPLCFATIAAARTPTLVTVHSLWRRYTALYRAADYAFRWSRFPVIWSAVSESAATAVRRAAARSLEVAVLPNGVDLEAWRGSRSTGEPDHLRIISVMRLAVRKRPLPLLRVLRAVRAAVPAHTRLSATIVGDGPQRVAIQRYLRRHDMTGWVTLTGQLTRPEVAAALASSDVFVAPATLESFGIAALEARAAGLTVVGRANTGLSDFVGAGGVLLDSDRAMSGVLTDLARRLPLVDPGDDRALARLSWVSTVERTRSLYRRAGYREGSHRARALESSSCQGRSYEPILQHTSPA